MAKILILSHDGRSLINFRGDLIREMIRRGHRVVAAVPEAEREEAVIELGADFVHFPINRAGMNPLDDYRYYQRIKKLMAEVQPDVVFAYAIKTVIYGSMAAKAVSSDIKMYSMVAGAGYVFTGSGFKSRLLRGLVTLLYRRSLPFNRCVFFQNPDDLQLFDTAGLLAGTKAVRVYGSGVNLDRFREKEPEVEPVTFLLIARLLWDKGIGEYAEAARILKSKGYSIRVQLLGPLDPNPSAISQNQVDTWLAEGILEYIEATEDVRPYLEKCSVYVLPSYREGTPRSVLEAMAMGRPIITTNAPGCRETVVDGENGYLVPVKDAAALAQAMEAFITDPERIRVMGKASRRMAEELYDVHKVNKVMLTEMEL